MKKRTRRLMVAAVLAVLVVLVVTASCRVAPPAPVNCTGRMALSPRVDPGPFWQRHRQHLEGDSAFDGLGKYYVVNGRTGETHSEDDWYFQANSAGRAWFWVHTIYALLHPGWDRDPWYLAYDCS